jgi:pyruvate formate lyase activating enzyme
MKKADYWQKTKDGKIRCLLCPHHCVIPPDKTGLCLVRQNTGNELTAVCYGVISSAQIDPIEKKPLYHFYPGSRIFSLGSWGCNFKCVFCQNFSISQEVMLNQSKRMEPDDIIQTMLANKLTSIAFTYNEPVINFEFIRDCARLAKQSKFLTVLVTNGFIEESPARELLPYIDAMNVDIKSMEDEFYIKYCSGKLQPVLNFCKLAHSFNCHIEITNLIIPSLNDKEELFLQLAGWIRENLSEEIALHLSAYYPTYRLSLPATPARTLEKAYEKCRSILPFVYLGNILTEQGQNTICSGCGNVVVARHGYSIDIRALKDGGCAICGKKCGIIH